MKIYFSKFRRRKKIEKITKHPSFQSVQELFWKTSPLHDIFPPHFTYRIVKIVTNYAATSKCMPVVLECQASDVNYKWGL